MNESERPSVECAPERIELGGPRPPSRSPEWPQLLLCMAALVVCFVVACAVGWGWVFS